jgi:adenylate kinase
LDGYPRNTAQAQFLDDLLAETGSRVLIAVVLELDRETAIKRSEGRRYSQDKQRVYNIYFNPPRVAGLDDIDGQPLIQREDDYREAVERRIDLYFAETAPLIDYYEAKALLEHVNAANTIESVAIDVIAAVARALMDR